MRGKKNKDVDWMRGGEKEGEEKDWILLNFRNREKLIINPKEVESKS